MIDILLPVVAVVSYIVALVNAIKIANGNPRRWTFRTYIVAVIVLAVSMLALIYPLH